MIVTCGNDPIILNTLVEPYGTGHTLRPASDAEVQRDWEV